MRRHLCLLLTAALCALSAAAQEAGWPTYGGDPGGQRYSPATQITRDNVRQLGVAWTFHTGARDLPRNAGRSASFEATPILFKGSLYLTSPFDEVYALDPATGNRRWTYEPSIDTNRSLGVVTSRGVAAWSPASPSSGPCADRIFLGTLDGRLIALDAATGAVCSSFGNNGAIDLTQNVDYRKGDDYAVTSPPTVVGDVVIVGAGIEDNRRVDIELGDVRGFDVRTGKLLWTWEPIPWAKQQTLRTGAANTWSIMAADLEHGLVYLPTSSASPDYYGGLRLGDGRDADSLVALDARTGKKVWAYQIVHHNIWDYDLAAQPLLFTFRGNMPAVAIATKTGMVFVFNRLTGEPLYEIAETPVPQTDVPGEKTSPTQPFSSLPPLSPLTLDLTRTLGANSADDAECRAMLAGKRYDGIFTPVSLRGSILFPSNVGGVNWGSTAFDPVSGMLYANTNRIPFAVTLRKPPLIQPGHAKPYIAALAVLLLVLFVYTGWRLQRGRGAAVALAVLVIAAVVVVLNRDRLREMGQKSELLGMGGFYVPHFGKEYGPDTGAPYTLLREPLETKAGHHPCSPTPWGTVSSLNLNTGKAGWQTPLGTMVAGQQTGTTSVGGPMVTAGGLVFDGASRQAIFRAYDAATGQELWTAPIPASAQATPMSYTWAGRQYVVVAAGGHEGFSSGESDALVAFALPGK